MKKLKNKGITLISLSMYIVGMLIVVITVGTITSFFYTNVAELRDSVDSLGEFNKFNVAFLEEVKRNRNSVDTIEESKIVFSNGTEFLFQDNGIYKNQVKICEQINQCQFSVSRAGNKEFILVYMEISTDFAKTMEYVMNINS